MAAAPAPVTRWAFPPPWLCNPAANEPTASPPRGQRPEPGSRLGAWLLEPRSDDALLALLERDLRRGHTQVAVRHFVMLRALGARIPAETEAQCERLVQCCSARSIGRTLALVERWVAMVCAGNDTMPLSSTPGGASRPPVALSRDL